jgi:hypothetical protein
VEPHCLSALVAAANLEERIALVSPLIYDYFDRAHLQFCGVFADMARQEFIVASSPGAGPPDGSPASPLLWGTALFVRSTAIRRIGYLDDRYFAYHEDLDYSLRALDAGFRTVVEPGAVVYHKMGGVSGLDSPFKVYLFSRNLYLWWSSHVSGLSRLTYPPKYLAWAIGRALDFTKAGNQDAANACLDGAWNGLRGHYGPPLNRITMPKSIRRFVLGHPYFCISLLTGNLKRICHAVVSRWRRST